MTGKTLNDFRYGETDTPNKWKFVWNFGYDPETKKSKEDERYAVPPKKQVLSWNVLIEDVNARKIVVYDILDNDGFFYNRLVNVKKKHGDDFKEFADYVHSELKSEFWCRCEWETAISDHFQHITKEEMDRLVEESKKDQYYYTVDVEMSERLDVYDQVMLNWDQFIHYLWDNKKKLVKHKK